MTSAIRAINKLVPFADASRPIWQDAIYSLILCTFLYFAPQLSWTRIRHILRNLIFGNDEKHAPQHAALEDDNVNDIHDRSQPNRDGPPAPTVEDDSDDDSDADSDDNDSLGDDEIAALIRQAEQQGALADPYAARRADPQRQQHRIEQLQPAAAAAAAAAGGAQQPPTNQQPRRLRDPNRAVGAKKAKSLARRERIRAYHEFVREQGDMQRAAEASTAAEREQQLLEARAKRAAAEAEIEAKNRRLREERRVAEQERVQAEQRDVGRTVEIVTEALGRYGRVEVQSVSQAIGRDGAWVEGVVRKEGMLETRQEEGGQVVVILTSRGWLVKVSEPDIARLESQAATYKGQTTGKVSWTEMGDMLDNILRKQHVIQ